MVLEEFVINNPLLSLILTSAMITFISTLLMKHFTDQEHIKSLKKRQKELQKEIKESQKKKEFTKLEELNKELIDLSLSLMKASFSIKMMLITFIPFILIFTWLKGIYNGVDETGDPLLKWWFLWYIGSAIFFSSIYRKLFKMA